MRKIFWSKKELLKAYEESLDDIYGTVNICGHEFFASQALKEIDHHAYYERFLDWMDSKGINEGKDNAGNFTYIWEEED